MLTIERLEFAYSEGHPLLNQLSLTMAPGDILGLLGPNGAGKTTLVSLITGLLQPKSGAILIDDAPARLGRRDVALVPQEYAFYERLTGRENLRYFAGVLGLSGARAKAAVDAALDGCRLQDVADRRSGHYSGGMKRRLNLAVALLQQPKLLILDEPTAGVDPHSRAFLLELVRHQNQQGASVIYTSHLLDEVQALCNRVAVMDHGRVLMEGPLEHLLAASGHLMTVSLDRPLSKDQQSRWFATSVQTCTFQFDLARLAVSPAEQLQALEAAGFGIQRVSYGERRLEEVFFELTQRELRD